MFAKRSGDLIQIVREPLLAEVDRPDSPIFSVGVPEVHSNQFFSDDSDPQVLAYAKHFFKEKWCRNDAASGASSYRETQKGKMMKSSRTAAMTTKQMMRRTRAAASGATFEAESLSRRRRTAASGAAETSSQRRNSASFQVQFTCARHVWHPH